jgi:hypothetical protein
VRRHRADTRAVQLRSRAVAGDDDGVAVHRLLGKMTAWGQKTQMYLFPSVYGPATAYPLP